MGWRDTAVPLNEEEISTPSWRDNAVPLGESADVPASNLETEILSRSEQLETAGRKGEEVFLLPEPTEELFVTTPPEDRQELFEAYRRHPRSTENWLGQVTYNGKPVPNPRSFSSELERSGVGTLAGSLWDMGKEVVTNAAAIGEEGMNSENPIVRGLTPVLGGGISSVAAALPGDQAEQLEENIPEFSPENPLGKFVNEAVPFGVGAVVGDKGVSKALPFVKSTLGKIGRSAGRLIGAEVTGAFAVDEDLDTAIIGLAKDNPSIRALAFDENGEYSRERLNKKLAQIQDGVLLSAVAGTGFHLGKKGYDFAAAPIIKGIKKWRDGTAEQKKFVETLVHIAGGLGDNPSRDELFKAYAEIGEFMEANKETIAKFGDPDVGDVKIANDSISNLIDMLKGKDTKKYANEIQQLEQLRSSALGSGAPQLNTKVKEGGRVLDESLDNFKTSRDYENSVPEAADMYAEKGLKEVGDAKRASDEATQSLDTLRKEHDDILREDPTFGPQIKEAETGKAKFNPRQAVEGTVDDIVSDVRTNRKSVEEEASKEYSKVHPFAKVGSPDTWDLAVNDVIDILPSGIRKAVLDSDRNYKKIISEVKPALNAHIHDLITEGRGLNRNAIDKLQGFSDYLTNSSTPKAMEQVRKADQNFAKTVGPLRQGPVEELRTIDKKFQGKPIDVAVNSRKTVIDALDDVNAPEYQNQIREVLEKSGKGGKVDDYYIGQAAVKAREEIISKGNLSPETVTSIRKSFESSRGLSPEAQKRFEGLLNKLQDKKVSIDEKEVLVQEAADNLAKIENEVYDGVLKDFFEKAGVKKNAKDTGFTTFDKILSDHDSLDKVKKILAKGDEPIQMRAWKAAWANKAKEKYFSGKEVKDLSNKVFDENFVKLGRELYGDQTIDGIELLAKKAREGDLANKTRMGQGDFDTGSNQHLATKAVNGLITYIWGVLNPTAARIRVMTGDFMKRYDSRDVSQRAGDLILSNSDEFLSILKQMEAEQRFKLSPNEKMLVRKSFIPGIKGIADDEEDETPFMKKLQNGANRVQRAKEQTEKIFE